LNILKNMRIKGFTLSQLTYILICSAINNINNQQNQI
jgi:hypothetical protein